MADCNTIGLLPISHYHAITRIIKPYLINYKYTLPDECFRNETYTIIKWVFRYLTDILTLRVNMGYSISDSYSDINKVT